MLTSTETSRQRERSTGGIARLFESVPVAPLVYMRVVFGAIMIWEVLRYFQRGWIHTAFLEPRFHFTYYGFDWVRPWPGNGLYWHFAAMGVLAVCVAVGFCYRFAAVLFWLAFTYVFLLEAALYLNHFYLVSILSFLLIFVPAHQAFSIDARLRPGIRSNTAPAWSLWLLRVQIGLVYFYAGVAKLNEDWLRGEPMRMWLAKRTDFPLIGRWFTDEWMVYAFSYGGMLLDLLVFPMLLWRRTRPIAFVGLIAFHLLNAKLFRIGIFPWLMLAITPLFCSLNWWRQFGREMLGILPPVQSGPAASADRLTVGQRVVVVLLAFWMLLQVGVPLRHFLYPGSVHWTEEGHRFSWHMKLRTKRATAEFFARDPVTGLGWPVDPLQYVEKWQLPRMSPRPDMVLQLAHHIATDLRERGYPQIEIRARVTAALNGRAPQLLIDPEADLAAQPRNLLPAGWILPLSAEPPGGGGEPEGLTQDEE
jgi:hypothetical protein